MVFLSMTSLFGATTFVMPNWMRENMWGNRPTAPLVVAAAAAPDDDDEDAVDAAAGPPDVGVEDMETGR